MKIEVVFDVVNLPQKSQGTIPLTHYSVISGRVLKRGKVHT